MPEKAVLAGQKGRVPGRFMSAPQGWFFFSCNLSWFSVLELLEIFFLWAPDMGLDLNWFNFIMVTQSLTHKLSLKTHYSLFTAFLFSLNFVLWSLNLQSCPLTLKRLPRSSNFRESEQGGRGEARGYYEGPHVELPGKISRHKCSPDSQLVSK